ncbi:hypothetical protein MWN41_05910 [Ornithobacterium rhinotracheale]|uniref:hypothetical protein n=1 Tax=Ornithobacterium rhinotracheale TaxID=28251 RepID=UPI001FF554AA|nr:hypothetical protein [Ornithobacterium rhinotracheale]MCK0202552.1 hypothetical protein [Ornithobacterium rhinotracheale]
MYFLFWAGLQNLFAVSNVSLSADIYTSIEIKKLAKAVGERANQKNIAIPQKIAKDIENLGSVKDKNALEDVPPGKFAEQFIKDLSRRDVNSLDQIKWIFDGQNFTKADFTQYLIRSRTK